MKPSSPSYIPSSPAAWHLLADGECYADPAQGHFTRLDPTKAKNNAIRNSTAPVSTSLSARPTQPDNPYFHIRVASLPLKIHEPLQFPLNSAAHKRFSFNRR